MSKPKTSDRILEHLRGLPITETPTIRELQKALGISSTSVVQYNLDLLEKSGEITIRRGGSRGIRLVQDRGPELLITLPWVPMEVVRGNARQHWAPKARAVAEMVGRGIEYGLVVKDAQPEIDFPLRGPLSVEITAWNPKQLDWENVGIGYKGFFDGLQVVRKRDQYGDAPGAGVIVDDSQLVDVLIKTRIGTPRTTIVLRRTEY